MSTITRPPAQPTEENTEHPHIVRTDGVPNLRGTRLAVRLLAQMHRAGDSVDDISRSYPQLDPAAIHDAISYYLDHRTEIEQEINDFRIETVLAKTGGKLDDRGFVSFKV